MALEGLLAAQVLVTLPGAPSLGEALALNCSVADPAFFAVALSARSQASSPCGNGTRARARAASVCLTFPSFENGTDRAALLAASLFITAAAPPPPGGLVSSLACELRSTPIEGPQQQYRRDPAQFPRYPALAPLPPLPLLSLPPALPALAAVLAESRAVPGLFRALGGVAAGRGPWEVGAPEGAPSWASPASAAPAAVARLRQRALEDALAGATPAPLNASLSGATHILLLLPASAPHTFASAPPAVYLGGVPCAFNWASADGLIASVTTPALSLLCGASFNGTDCGRAPLVVGFAPPGSAADVLDALGASPPSAPPLPPLPVPAAYPPLALTPAPWSARALPQLINASAPLLALPLPALLLAIAPATASGVGLLLATACTDYAPAASCAPGLPPPATGPACGWGLGDGCAPCPATASCPGGNVIYPLPGYWAPQLSSPPAEVAACPAPGALTRCPGWSAPRGANLCGAGFSGQLCTVCLPGYFQAEGSCLACPLLSALMSQLQPILVFAAGLLGFGALMVGVAHWILWRGGAKPTLRGAHSSSDAVASLLVWAWMSAQSTAALFAQARRNAPPELLTVFSALASLQFAGIAYAPACYNAPPLQAFWAAVVGVGIAVAATGLGLLMMGVWGGGGRVLRAGSAAALGALLVQGAGLALTLGYGAFSSLFMGLLICLPAKPMTLSDYALAASDGRALRLALGGGAPSISALRASAASPAVAQQLGLQGALSTTIPVQQLASDPYTICFEGPHAAAWPVAVALTVSFTLGLPLVGLGALWAAGRCKGLRRWLARRRMPAGAAYKRPRSLALRGGAASKAAATGAEPPFPTAPLPALLASLEDSTIHPRAAWFSFYQLFVVALFTGGSAVLSQLTSLGPAAALSAALALVALGSAYLVLRVRPHRPAHAWKGTVLAALFALSAATCVLTAVMQGQRSGSGTAGTAVASVTMALGLLTVALLLGGWLRSLVAQARARALLLGTLGGGAGSGGESGAGGEPWWRRTSVSNPLWGAAGKGRLAGARARHSGTHSDEPDAWEPVVDADGDAFFQHAVTGETRWHRPGAEPWRRAHAPGGEGHLWLCQATGATVGSDAELPLGAVTVDGWVLCSEGAGGGDQWWWRPSTGECAWAGPWVEAEAREPGERRARGAAVAREAAAAAAARAARRGRATTGVAVAGGLEARFAALAPSAAAQHEQRAAVERARRARVAADAAAAAALVLAREEEQAARAALARAGNWRLALY